MTIWQAAFLGVLQGVTEFLPISSSGHLVIAERMLDIASDGGPLWETMAHAGTLLAICVVFRLRLAALARYGLWEGWAAMARQGLRVAWWEAPLGRQGLLIGLASVPTALIGLGFHDFFAEAFNQARWAGFGLLATAALLALSRLRASGREEGKPVGAVSALAIGVAQGVAIFPGLSRSGSTISAGLLLGVGGAAAFEFSFLISIPAILGASALELRHFPEAAGANWSAAAAILAASFVSGWAALLALRAVVSRGRLSWFALYCFPAGALAVLLL